MEKTSRHCCLYKQVGFSTIQSLESQELAVSSYSRFQDYSREVGFVACSLLHVTRFQKNCYPFTATSCAIATVLTAAIHTTESVTCSKETRVKTFLEIHLHNKKSNDLPSTTQNPTPAAPTRNRKGLMCLSVRIQQS